MGVTDAAARARLIPAHAGKTHPARPHRTAGRAHPRSRGENLTSTSRERLCGGSSPLTRGKHIMDAAEDVVVGLIPAHAGKTVPVCGYLRRTGAHPRSRGENAVRQLTQTVRKGSSPLTRGKLGELHDAAEEVGLIPAHAGKTLFDKTHVTSRRAHPRSRGENRLGPDGARLALGSSPLTRGKRRRPAQQPRAAGLIPAHAGKTQVVTVGHATPWAHPRSRGENGPAPGMVPTVVGSSPLTRGKHACFGGELVLFRLIPAHAGKTPSG